MVGSTGMTEMADEMMEEMKVVWVSILESPFWRFMSSVSLFKKGTKEVARTNFSLYSSIYYRTTVTLLHEESALRRPTSDGPRFD